VLYREFYASHCTFCFCVLPVENPDATVPVHCSDKCADSDVDFLEEEHGRAQITGHPSAKVIFAARCMRRIAADLDFRKRIDSMAFNRAKCDKKEWDAIVRSSEYAINFAFRAERNPEKAKIGLHLGLPWIQEMLGRFETNGFNVGAGDEPIGLGVYDTAACFNHSCVANVSPDYVYRKGFQPMLEVSATKALERGEEMVFSYIDEGLSYLERNVDLLARYSFVCSCVKCGDAYGDAKLEGYRCGKKDCTGFGVRVVYPPVVRRGGETSEAASEADRVQRRCSLCKTVGNGEEGGGFAKKTTK
jgi:hypothetical protein